MAERIKVAQKSIGDTLTHGELNEIVNKTNTAMSEYEGVHESQNLALGNKVEKVAGKGLSTNDFSNEAAEKLNSVAESANKYEHPLSHSATMINETADRKFMTAAEKTKVENFNNETASSVKNKLEGLTGDDRLDASAVKNLPEGGGITSLLFADFKTAKDSNGLTAGSWYEITDFATAYNLYVPYMDQIVEARTGENEPLFVFAISNNSIAKEAYSALYPYDIIHYDCDETNWNTDKGYSDGNGNILANWKGTISFRHDTIQDNYCPYDFRNVQFRRWKVNIPAWDDVTTFSQKTLVYDPNDSDKLYVALENNQNAPFTDTSKWVDTGGSYLNSAYFAPFPYDHLTDLTNSVDMNDYLDFYTFPKTDYSKYKTIHIEKAENKTGQYSNLLNIVFQSYTAELYTEAINILYGFNMTFQSCVVDLNFKGLAYGNVFLGHAQYIEFPQNFTQNVIFRLYEVSFTGTRYTNNIFGAYLSGSCFTGFFEYNLLVDNVKVTTFAPGITNSVIKTRSSETSNNTWYNRLIQYADDHTLRCITINAATNEFNISTDV